MRSYYAHLENAMNISKGPISPKPVFRSSAIFPMINLPGITSRVIFMGYWILKRNIKQIACVTTLRSEIGTILYRSHFLIQEAKTFRFELKEQLALAGLSSEISFIGSLEIEFFSTEHLVFPFPALVINYYGDHFNTVVHTAQRIYNDFEDMLNNSQTQVPESGFNIYADDDREPFFAFINGAEEVKNAFIKMEFYNHLQEVLYHEMNLGTMHPYQTKIVYPAQEVNLKDFLNGKVGAAKIYFKLNWIFPRLVVGNIQHSLPALTITHSYYDCSQAKSESDYWRPSESQWYPASLMVPLLIQKTHYTNIYFYPIYSPSQFIVDIEIYQSNGQMIGKKENLLCLDSPFKNYQVISFKSLCQELAIPEQPYLAARIIARTKENQRIPARIKIALDIGQKEETMPCNICTNLQPFNPALETKPKSFRWAPFLADQKNATIWLMNSSPHTHYEKTAEIQLTFFREKDSETLKRTITLAPHGFQVIKLSEEEELQQFFENHIGWFTATTSNPYTTTYYFTEHPSGVVGGDHGF